MFKEPDFSSDKRYYKFKVFKNIAPLYLILKVRSRLEVYQCGFFSSQCQCQSQLMAMGWGSKISNSTAKETKWLLLYMTRHNSRQH